MGKLKHLAGQHNQLDHGRKLSNVGVRSKLVDKASDIPYEADGSKIYFVTPDEKLLPAETTHMDTLTNMSDKDFNVAFGFVPEAGSSIARQILDNNVIRVREGARIAVVQTGRFDTSTLRKIQRLVDTGKIVLKPTVVWGDKWNEGVTTSYDEIMSAKYVTNSTLKDQGLYVPHADAYLVPLGGTPTQAQVLIPVVKKAKKLKPKRKGAFGLPEKPSDTTNPSATLSKDNPNRRDKT